MTATMTFEPDSDQDESRVRHLFTAAEAEKVLGIAAGTIRAWASKRWLWHYGLDKRGRPMYDRDHLLELKRRSMRTVRTRHRATRTDES